jgi:hypothetical protein
MADHPPDGGTTRLERDSFGDIRVPAARLWGAQTQRSLQHFDISTECLPDELIHALVLVKRAARLGPGPGRLLTPPQGTPCPPLPPPRTASPALR